MKEPSIRSNGTPLLADGGVSLQAVAAVRSLPGRLCDLVAAKLIKTGVSPNMLTVTGCILTGAAGVFLVVAAGHTAPWEAGRAVGPASWWPFGAAVLFTLACACDFLDGAVARGGALQSRFGAMLDSTLDRFSDLFIFSGCAMHFALVENITYVTLSLAAAGNAVLISYVKARAENLIDRCDVGFWTRGERCGVFLAAAYAGHIPAALWLFATLPALTVLRRVRHTHRLLGGTGAEEAGDGLRRWLPWRHPRGSAGYLLCIGLALAYVFVAPLIWPALYGAADPLRIVLARIDAG